MPSSVDMTPNDIGNAYCSTRSSGVQQAADKGVAKLLDLRSELLGPTHRERLGQQRSQPTVLWGIECEQAGFVRRLGLPRHVVAGGRPAEACVAEDESRLLVPDAQPGRYSVPQLHLREDPLLTHQLVRRRERQRIHGVEGRLQRLGHERHRGIGRSIVIDRVLVSGTRSQWCSDETAT